MPNSVTVRLNPVDVNQVVLACNTEHVIAGAALLRQQGGVKLTFTPPSEVYKIDISSWSAIAKSVLYYR